MAELTYRQAEVLDFITSYHAEHGYSPTIRTICAEFGIASPSTAHIHVLTLVKKGRLVRVERRGQVEYEPVAA